MDANGFPVVAWNEEVGGYDSRLWQTYVKRWDGTNWIELDGSGSGSGLSDTPGTTQGNMRERPSLAIDAGNRPVVAWHDDAIGQYELYIKVWDNGAWVELEGSGSDGGVSDNSADFFSWRNFQEIVYSFTLADAAADRKFVNFSLVSLAASGKE